MKQLMYSTSWKSAVLVAIFFLSVCANARAADVTIPFSRATYEAIAKEKALVLVSANWARRWKCGSFDNAQLRLSSL